MSMDGTSYHEFPIANLILDNPIPKPISNIELTLATMSSSSQHPTVPPKVETLESPDGSPEYGSFDEKLIKSGLIRRKTTSNNKGHFSFVLCFDAKDWAHWETTNEVELFNGTIITRGSPGGARTMVQSTGVLGTYPTQLNAMKRGGLWLQSQVFRVKDERFVWPLPVERGQIDSRKGVWKRSGWGQKADGSLCYKVTDFERDLTLKVTVTVTAGDESDDDGTYETEPEEEGTEEKDAE